VVSATAPLVSDSTAQREPVLKNAAERNSFLENRKQTLEHLEHRLSKLRSRRAVRINPQTDTDLHDLDSKVLEAKDDIGKLTIANQASWERYQVHLDNTILDIRRALRKAKAE
jgi:hypothetical protein